RSPRQLRGARLELACANVKAALTRFGPREVQAGALSYPKIPPRGSPATILPRQRSPPRQGCQGILAQLGMPSEAREILLRRQTSRSRSKSQNRFLFGQGCTECGSKGFPLRLVC